MIKSDSFPSPDSPQESGIDLAEFLTPIEHTPFDPALLPPDGQLFPAVFYLHEKITDSVQQVHLALVRLNASPKGPQIFRQDGRLVRVVRTEEDTYVVVPLDRNRLRLVLSEAGTWKRFLKDGIDVPDKDRKSTRLNSSHSGEYRRPVSA